MRGWLTAAIGAMALVTATSARAQELTLTRALELGRQRSWQLKGARAKVESAEANIDEQKAAYYPSLSASIKGTGSASQDTQIVRNQQVGGGGSDLLLPVVSYPAGVAGSAPVRWTVYDFGKTGNSVTAAEAMHAGATAGQASTEISIQNDVASAFVNLHYKEQLRDVSRATLAGREKLVVIAKGLIKAGLQPPLEEVRASARAEAARVQVASTEADVLDARAQLAALLGLDPSLPLRISPPRLPSLDMDAAVAMKDSEKLPQVAAAAADRDAKDALAEVAFSKYLPTISFQIDDSYSFTKYDTSSLLTNSRQATAALLVSVPIFDASLGPNLTGARADAATSAAVYEQAKRDVKTEAARAAFAVRTTAVAAEHARKSAEGAANVLAIVQARYLQGLSSPLELIDAETSDADARTQKTQSELTHALAIVRLSTATGRKLEEAP